MPRDAMCQTHLGAVVRIRRPVRTDVTVLREANLAEKLGFNGTHALTTFAVKHSSAL